MTQQPKIVTVFSISNTAAKLAEEAAGNGYKVALIDFEYAAEAEGEETVFTLIEDFHEGKFGQGQLCTNAKEYYQKAMRSCASPSGAVYDRISGDPRMEGLDWRAFYECPDWRRGGKMFTAGLPFFLGRMGYGLLVLNAPTVMHDSLSALVMDLPDLVLLDELGIDPKLTKTIEDELGELNHEVLTIGSARRRAGKRYEPAKSMVVQNNSSNLWEEIAKCLGVSRRLEPGNSSAWHDRVVAVFGDPPE